MKPRDGAALIWVLLAMVAWWPGTKSFPVFLNTVDFCWFRRCTGLPCPGCGMTHAIIAAFQGRWIESFHAHPLGIPFLALWTLWLVGPAWSAVVRWNPFSNVVLKAGLFSAVIGVYLWRLVEGI